MSKPSHSHRAQDTTASSARQSAWILDPTQQDFNMLCALALNMEILEMNGHAGAIRQIADNVRRFMFMTRKGPTKAMAIWAPREFTDQDLQLIASGVDVTAHITPLNTRCKIRDFQYRLHKHVLIGEYVRKYCGRD